MKKRHLKYLSVFTLLLSSFFAFAQKKDKVISDKILVIGTKEAPPFSFKKANGQWTGISIDLWDKIARSLDLKYKFKEYSSVGKALDAVEKKEVDISLAAITINSTREKRVDFSHPYFTTSLALALLESKKNNSLLAIFFALLNREAAKVLVFLTFLLFFVGFFVWLFERKKNPEQFDPSPSRGIWDGFWWAAVTLATVGYGDKAPKSELGKILGLFWMVLTIILLSFFTAIMASTLTVNSLGDDVEKLKDLRTHNYHVGTTKGTSCQSFLTKHGIKNTTFESVPKGLKALSDEKIDAFFCDRPLMQYTITRNYSNHIFLLDKNFSKDDYGIAFPTGSPLRGKTNEALLEIIKDKNYWNVLIKSYLGPESL